MIAFAAFLVLTPKPADPAFAFQARMVGGTWVGATNGVQIEQTFKLEQDGQLIHMQGRARQGKKVLANIDAVFAWDPDRKRVYYLDRHNADTVYFGHLSLEGRELVTEFKGLAGDPHEYVIRQHFEGPDTYEFHMWERRGEKLVDVHLDTVLKRRKS